MSLPIAGLAQDRNEPQDSDIVRTRPFQVYDSMEVRALQEKALEHLEAQRLPEGLDLLQKLIENHRGEVLPPRTQPASGQLEGTVHEGAPAWARAQLFALNSEGRAAYLRMFAADAELAMQRALTETSIAQWLEIARRWPITPAAYARVGFGRCIS